MNITADNPLTLLSFLLIFALIAFCCGIFFASFHVHLKVLAYSF